MVVIRLSRTGAKKRPFYHICVTDRRKKRDGNHIEKLGFFNPIAKKGEEKIRLDVERFDYWTSVGAIPSDTVMTLYKRSKLSEENVEKIEEKILLQNQRVFDEVARIKETYKIVGAFQTRNIPHFGHEKIIERMLEVCDHVVINPVIGPKKSGDVKLEVLEMIYEYLILHKYEHRISFLPIFGIPINSVVPKISILF